MKEQNKKKSDAEKLRQKAEQQLKKQQSEVDSLTSEIDIRKINHELQVHQIELEMQNEELMLAKTEADAAASKYTELYDFAPSGYFTLTEEGEITELNIHGARLLGKERQKLINARFGFFVSDDTKPILNLFLDKVFEGKGYESCEVTLSIESKDSPTYVYVTGHVAENNEQCQINVVDITERKKAEEALLQNNNALNKLNRFAFELTNLSADDNLEVFITKQVKEISGAEGALFAEYDSDKKIATPRHIELDSGLLDKVVNLLGTKLQNIHSEISDKFFREMTTEMIGKRQTLFEMSQGAIPHPVAASIQALLKADRFIGIAYLLEGKLYGIIVLAMGKNKPDPPKEILKNFIHLASVSLRRRQSEQLTIELNNFKTAIENSMQAGVAVVSPEGKQSYVNPFFCKMVGWSAEELLDKPTPFVYWSPDGIEIINNALQQTLLGEAPKNGFELKFIRKNKEVFDVLVRLSELKSAKNEIIGWLAVVNDITDRKQADKALKESEEKYKNVVETTSELITIVDNDGRFTFVNHVSNNFYGLSPKDCLGRLAFDFIHPDDKEYTQNKFSEWITSKQDRFYIENRQISLNGTTIYTAWHIYIERQNNGIINITSIGRDITKRKSAEDSLRKHEKTLLQLNADKDRFISILAHDLKSPFNNLLGFSELLTKNIRKYDTDKIETFVNHINNSARSSHDLLNELLSWARAQQGKIPFEPQNLVLTDVCNDVIKILNPTASEKNIAIKCLVKDTLNVFADADMLKTVLRNLISNAIKFTNSGGSIDINAEQNSENVTISVSDNGVGIPPENLGKLFDISEVQTAKGTAGESGTGLGLLLCKEFVENHQGKIWAESEPGKGSDFIFTLPSK